MIAAEIVRALGAAQRSGAWWRCRCPVHQSHGPTLALRDGERCLIVKCFAGCDPRDILAELARSGLIEGRRGEPRAEPRTSRPIDRGNNDRHSIERARRLWEAAQDARGSPVANYLAGRGITMPLPPSLRWAPRCWHGKARHYLPAVVAAIVDVAGALTGVQRTYLRPDGSGKADVEPAKAMLGRAAGGAVRLASAAETLMIGEGCETVMAAMQATAMPGWAALSTSGMTALLLPPIVRTIIILADHDCNGAGERAARTAGERWLAEDRRVRLAMPLEPGTDFNDLLMERRSDAA